MRERHIVGALAALAAAATPVGAASIASIGRGTGGAITFPPYLQCVPYARQVSGIQIYGDAHTWWGQAEGRYAKGGTPRVGAVMAFRPSGSSRLGHVAAVSKIIDSRTLLISHANWSPINGRRGQIEKNVRAVDVSPNNDWSQVRVWYAPIKALGGRHWPVSGFIYNEKPGARGAKLAKPERGEPRADIKAGLGRDIKLDRDAKPGGNAKLARPAKPIKRGQDPIGAIIARH